MPIIKKAGACATARVTRFYFPRNIYNYKNHHLFLNFCISLELQKNILTV